MVVLFYCPVLIEWKKDAIKSRKWCDLGINRAAKSQSDCKDHQWFQNRFNKMDTSITDHYIFYLYIVASVVIVVTVSWIFFFFNYTSIIRHNMLLLHRMLNQYYMTVYYQIYRYLILLTTYMNVNFSKMLEMVLCTVII